MNLREVIKALEDIEELEGGDIECFLFDNEYGHGGVEKIKLVDIRPHFEVMRKMTPTHHTRKCRYIEELYEHDKKYYGGDKYVTIK